MKYSIPLGCVAALVCFVDAAVAKSPAEIESLAKAVTVEMITGTGSGVIVHRQGNLYSLVTNRHVVCGSGSCNESRLSDTYRLRTADGQVHQAAKAGVKLLKDAGGNKLDLAIVQFRSSRTYQVAQFSKADSLQVDAAVYSAGFPKELGFRFGSGAALAVVNKRLTGDRGGYTVVYNASTLPGMSGGGVFDQNGQLVAIHGVGDRYQTNSEFDEISPTGTSTIKNEVGSKIGYNRGIPVRWVLQGLKDHGITIDNKPSSPGSAANLSTATTADELFIAGFNKWMEPGDDVLADKKEAVSLLTQAIKLNPRYALAYFTRAVVYDQLQQYPQALADLNQSIALDPNNANAYYNRGLLKYEKLNDPAGALADFDQAIAINPGYVLAYNNRGFLKYEKLNDPSGALADYNRAIALNPQYSLAHNNRGLLKYERLGDGRGALADFDRAIAFDPKLFIAYSNRGVLRYLVLQDVPGALADYNQSLALNPKYALVYNNRGNLKKDSLNDPRGALADYNQAIALNPRYALAYSNRGFLKQSEFNDRPGALADYNQALSIEPTLARAYAGRGLLKYEKLGDRAGGIADMRQAAQLARTQGNAQLARGAEGILQRWTRGE